MKHVGPPLTVEQASRVVRQRTGKTQPTSRGERQTFLAENGWQIVAKSARKGTYHEIEAALVEALEEVRLRIDNRVNLM